jgi:signal transduction histidine kinase
MKEIEITEIPPLEPGESSLVDLHSVLNVLNVLHGELTLLGLDLADDDKLLRDGMNACARIVDSLGDRQRALAEAARIGEVEALVFAELEPHLARAPEAVRASAAESVANLRSVFAILTTRARELLARAEAPDRWEPFEVGALRASFLEVFSAIEKNAKGRYRILYNAAQQEPSDYYVDLKLEVADGQTLWLPPVIQDVMRDLIANARKYTPPSGRITAALYQDAAELRLVVADTGRGIPEAELAEVVKYGRRASNVADVRTMGGGFGLTKAFLVTRQFGGRFWLASALGVGTRVRIAIPRAQASAGGAVRAAPDPGPLLGPAVPIARRGSG